MKKFPKHILGQNMISIKNLNAYYGDLQVLWDVSLEVEENEFVTVIGPNGAGKSTLLNTISGLVKGWEGEISVLGKSIAELSPSGIVELGHAIVPEEKHLFPDMTVLENLEMGAYTKRGREKKEETLEEVFDLCPILDERRNQLAESLSGGEQRMLAIGRGLMIRPQTLALDEPSAGLAPKITQDLFETIKRISKDVTILLVEQHVETSLKLADRAYLLEKGEIVECGTGDELLESDRIREVYLED